MRFGEIIGLVAAHAGGVPQGREGGGHRHLGADHRRDRHRQGADRARDPQPLAARQGPVHHHQLRRDPGEPARVGAVRPRRGRLHRGGRQQGRQVPGRRRRHAVPRRDRRDAAARCRSRSCARCRSGWSCASATPGPSRSTSASSPPPTASSTTRSRPAASARTSTTGSTSSTSHLPPLRERGDDIVVLARYLLSRYAHEYGGTVRGLSPNADRGHQAPPLAGQHPRAREPHQEGGGAGGQGAARPGGPRPFGRRPAARSCRWPRPRRSSSASTSTRCSRSTTATAPRPRAISASIRARSSATWRRAKAARTARRRTGTDRAALESFDPA